MGIKIEINLTNKWLYSLIAFVIILVLGAGVFAYNSNMQSGTPNVMGHSAGELDVKVEGTVMKLQDAIDGGYFAGGITLGSIQNTDIGQVGGTGALLDIPGTTGVVHQAATDGLVMAWKTGNRRASLFIGPTSTSMVEVLQTNIAKEAYEHSLGSALVKQGEYWQITKVSHGTAIVHWRPIT